MSSKKTASKIGPNKTNRRGDLSHMEPLPRTSRGSLEIFVGGRAQSETAVHLHSRPPLRQQNSPFSVGEGNSERLTEVSLERESRFQELVVPGYGRVGSESKRAIAKHRGQVSRWLADVSDDTVPVSQSQSSLHLTDMGSEKRGSDPIALVDDDLLSMLRISESPDWQDLKFNELLAGTFKFVNEEHRVEDTRYGSKTQSNRRVPTDSFVAEMPSEWEGVLEEKSVSQERGSGRPPRVQSKPTRKSWVSESEAAPEWEEVLQGKGITNGAAGLGTGNGRNSNNKTWCSTTPFTADTCEVPPDWEGVLQGEGQAGNNGTSLASRKSRTSLTSETSPEWDRVLRRAGESVSHGRRSSRQSRQSNVSGTSAMSEESLVSERGAQWGYEVKLKNNTGDERLSGSSWVSASGMSEDSSTSERTAQWGYEVKQPKNNINVDDRLSGSSWISATSLSDGSKSSWTTSTSEASLAHAIPAVSKSIKDALSSFQLAFVVCDATDPDHPILYASEGFFSMTGYCASEVVGKNCRLLQGGDTAAGDVSKIREALNEGKIYTGKILNYRKDATPFWNLLTISPIKDDHGKLIKWIGMLAEVDENNSTHEEKLRVEMHTRIKEQSQRQTEMDPKMSSGRPLSASSPAAQSKKVEISSKTSIPHDTRPYKSQECLRRTSYSLTNQSYRYSGASSRLVSAESSLDLPEWQAAGRSGAEASPLKDEAVKSNVTNTSSSGTAGKSKTSRFGRFFKKLRGISSSALKRKSEGCVGDTPYEFSDSSGEEHEVDTTNPREAAELARLQRCSANLSKNSADDERLMGRRSSGNSYYTAVSESQETPSSMEDEAPRGSTRSKPSGIGAGSGNRNLGQFCIVHS